MVLSYIPGATSWVLFVVRECRLTSVVLRVLSYEFCPRVLSYECCPTSFVRECCPTRQMIKQRTENFKQLIPLNIIFHRSNYYLYFTFFFDSFLFSFKILQLIPNLLQHINVYFNFIFSFKVSAIKKKNSWIISFK